MGPAAPPRQRLRDARQLGRLVARARAGAALPGRAVEPLRRNVGRVGLEHEGVVRDAGGEAPDLQRALERHRAAEAELEAERDEHARLLLAAVVGMNDAPRHLDAAQRGEQRVGRAPHVHDDGQRELARELELLDPVMLLARPVVARHEMIEADLADGDEPRIVAMPHQRVAQARQVAGIGVLDEQRVDAQRIGAVVLRGERAHGVEVLGADRRQHQPRHARGTGARDDGVTVGVELGRIEMAVRVDPHRADAPPSLAQDLAITAQATRAPALPVGCVL